MGLALGSFLGKPSSLAETNPPGDQGLSPLLPAPQIPLKSWVGASGSGKSTLLRCLNCMEDPTGGSIYFEGVDLADMRVNINHYREHMGMVFQQFNLFNNKTILDNITLAPIHIALRNMRKEKIRRFFGKVDANAQPLKSKKEIIAEKKSERGGFVVLCDGIEDVHNLGSIIRVAECAGADGVVIPKSGSASVTEAVIRISAGAAEHMKVAKVPNLNQAVEKLQKEGYWVYALEAGGEDIYKENFAGNVALIVGGEDSGVKRLTKEKCDKILSIPLQGQVNSLNASVALGIAAYEVVRNRL